MLMRPSFVDNLVTPEDYDTPFNKHTQMYDIQDSPTYKAQEIGLKQVVDEDGTVQDIEASPGSHQCLESCDIGHRLMINLDW